MTTDRDDTSAWSCRSPAVAARRPWPTFTRALRGLALAGALAGPVAPLLCPTVLAAGGEVSVLLTKAEALAAVFPTADRVLELRHMLSPGETLAIERILHHKLDEGGFFLYRATRGEALLGYAVVVSQIGKVRPITHIVGVSPEGEVATVAVMIYRESHGQQIASERFMAQYRGKGLDDSIRVGRDIANIAGATLSGNAICRGVRKALAVVTVLFLRADADELARRLQDASDVTPPSLLPRQDAPGPDDGQQPLHAAAPAAAQAPQRLAPSPPDQPRIQDDGALRLERRVMGTLCSVVAYPEPGELAPAALAAALSAALDEVERIDGVLSDWRADTPLSRFNQAATGQWVTLEPELAAWLDDARAWASLTDGAFDPALGALVSAWGLRSATPARPDVEALRAARAVSGLALIEVCGPRARRLRPRVALDPGASGKGYALDRAAEVLRQHGVRRALISFRSTLLALGPPPGSRAWSIPVVHDGPGEEVARVELADASLSVSGGSLRAFDDNGVARGHVLDPHSGVPVPAERLAWVLWHTAAGSDALATALLVDGLELPAPDGARGAFLSAADAQPHPWPAAP